MVKKLWGYVKPFSSDTGTLLTDGQTELLYQYRASKARSVSQYFVVSLRDKQESIDAWHISGLAFVTDDISKMLQDILLIIESHVGWLTFLESSSRAEVKL